MEMTERLTFTFFPPTKQKSHSCRKQIVSKGEKEGGINWEIEIDCIAQETPHYSVMTYMGIES